MPLIIRHVRDENIGIFSWKLKSTEGPLEWHGALWPRRRVGEETQAGGEIPSNIFPLAKYR